MRNGVNKPRKRKEREPSNKLLLWPEKKYKRI